MDALIIGLTCVLSLYVGYRIGVHVGGVSANDLYLALTFLAIDDPHERSVILEKFSKVMTTRQDEVKAVAKVIRSKLDER